MVYTTAAWVAHRDTNLPRFLDAMVLKPETQWVLLTFGSGDNIFANRRMCVAAACTYKRTPKPLHSTLLTSKLTRTDPWAQASQNLEQS